MFYYLKKDKITIANQLPQLSNKNTFDLQFYQKFMNAINKEAI